MGVFVTKNFYAYAEQMENYAARLSKRGKTLSRRFVAGSPRMGAIWLIE